MENNSESTDLKIQNVEFIDIKSDSKNSQEGNYISIGSYNLLGDYYVKNLEAKDKYRISCTEDYIKIENRYKLIIETIKRINTDIFFLQEVDCIEEFYRKGFNDAGYEFVFKKKNSKAGDAISIIYKCDKFEYLKHIDIDLDNHPFQDDSVYKKGFVAVCLELFHKESKKKVIFLVTHLYHDPTVEHVRYLQTCIILEYLAKNYTKDDIIFWGGDLNSLEKDNNMQYILKKSEPEANLIDFYNDGIIASEKKAFEYYSKISDSFIWTNLYSHYGKALGRDQDLPKYTNYAKGFKGTIDHIFYRADCVKLVKILKIDEDEIEKYQSLPSEQFPSDHIPIAGVFII